MVLRIGKFKTSRALSLLVLLYCATGSAIASTTITSTYSQIGHRLQSTKLVSAHGNFSSVTGARYLIGNAASSVTQSFPVTNISNQNSYKIDPGAGLLLVRQDQRDNVLTYQYNNNGIRAIRYYHAKNIEAISGQPKLTVTYHHNSFGAVTEIKRTPGFNTYNILGANGRLNEIIRVRVMKYRLHRPL